MLSLIDGDILIYRIGFTTQDVDTAIAFSRMRTTLDEILLRTAATEFRVFLTEEGHPSSFRRLIYPEYKANRQQPKPLWYKELREYLVAEYDAEICTEIEADDAMGISQTEDSVICSIDKDLKQIPGQHYNFVKDAWDHITPLEGLRNFYTQLLTGDSSDNIKGVYKIGPKTAERLLFGLRDEQELFNKVRETYSNDDEMLMNGRVLYIWQQPNDDWQNHWSKLQ